MVARFLSFRVPGFASAYNRLFSEHGVVAVVCQPLPLLASLRIANDQLFESSKKHDIDKLSKTTPRIPVTAYTQCKMLPSQISEISETSLATR